MKMALIGLGKMGGNMATRMCRAGIEVVGYDRGRETVDELVRDAGMTGAESVDDAISKLEAPRVVWLMLPAGEVTETVLRDVSEKLSPGDLIVDGGNANYHESQRRGLMLSEKGILFADAGTSGGIWGLENGYCLMVGGTNEAIGLLEPALKALAPAEDRGWAHVGPVGAGHFTKMIHNGIEYGMMQAYAEGFALLRGKEEFNIDLARVSELWRHSSVVRSWLLDLTAEALAEDQDLADIAPIVPDSGEGRWTADEAIDQGVPAPVMTLAVHMRFASQDQEGYPNRLLSMMRNAFGGHAVAKSKKKQVA